MIIVCSGASVVTDQYGAPLCLESDETTPAQWQEWTQSEGLLPEGFEAELFAQAFAAGFSLVGAILLLSLGIRAVIRTVRSM